MEYHLLLTHDLHLLDDTVYSRLNTAVVEVKRMLSAFVRKVENERLAG